MDRFVARLSWLGVLLVGCAAPDDQDTIELKTQEFRWAALGSRDHGDMTEDALSFLKVDVAEEIADANEDTDSGSTQHKSRFHVDNCRVGEAFAAMRELHEQAVVALNPAAPNAAAAKAAFGRLTHTAQDFYAHSNWVEAGQQGIVARHELVLPVASPGDRLGSLIVLPAIPAAGTWVTRNAGSRVPLLHGPDGPLAGWMSGTYAANEEPSVCPASVAIPHGPFAFNANDPLDSYLSKDNPFAPYFASARPLAMAQTREEFCRLDRLVTLRYGVAGHDALLNAWVKSTSGFASACSDNAGLVAAAIMASL